MGKKMTGQLYGSDKPGDNQTSLSFRNIKKKIFDKT